MCFAERKNASGAFRGVWRRANGEKLGSVIVMSPWSSEVLNLGPLGRDERNGAAYQLQEAGAPKAPADVVAARADVAVCRTSRELPAGHVIERRAEHSAAQVGPEAPPDQRVAQILLPQAPHFLVEVVAIRLRTIGSHSDAKPRVGGLDLVQHLPRAPVLPPATAEVEVGEGLGDRPKGRFTSRPAALPAGAVVPGQAAPVEERALREVSQVRVATAIQMGEKAGEHPEHEVWGQMDGYRPVAALEPGQPLRRRATATLATLATLAALARRHAGYTEPTTRGRAPLRVPLVARRRERGGALWAQDTAVLSIRSYGDTCLSEATGNDCTLGPGGSRRGCPTHYKCVVGTPRAI